MAQVRRRRRADRRRAARRPAPRDHRAQGRAGDLRLRVQEQGRAAAARRGRRLPAVAGRHRRRCRASTPTRDKPRDAQRRRRRAVRRARLQDHERPVRRSAHLLPRLLGHARRRLDGLQRDQGQARAHRPPPAHARQQARGHQDHRGGQHRRRRRPARHHHGRHAVRREAPDPARAHAVRQPGHLAGDRAARPRPTRTSMGAGAVTPRRRGPDVPRPHRRRDRPDDHLGHGRAAPRDHRRPHEAASSRSRPTSASRRSPTARRSPQPVVEDYKHIKQTGGHGQYGHVKLRIEPNERGKGVVFANEIVGGVIPKEFIPAVEKGVARVAATAASSPASRSSTSRSRSSTAATTTSTSSAMAFELAGSLALREARAGAAPDPARADHERRSGHPRRVHRAPSSAI